MCLLKGWLWHVSYMSKSYFSPKPWFFFVQTIYSFLEDRYRKLVFLGYRIWSSFFSQNTHCFFGSSLVSASDEKTNWFTWFPDHCGSIRFLPEHFFFLLSGEGGGGWTLLLAPLPWICFSSVQIRAQGYPRPTTPFCISWFFPPERWTPWVRMKAWEFYSFRVCRQGSHNK